MYKWCADFYVQKVMS